MWRAGHVHSRSQRTCRCRRAAQDLHPAAASRGASTVGRSGPSSRAARSTLGSGAPTAGGNQPLHCIALRRWAGGRGHSQSPTSGARRTRSWRGRAASLLVARRSSCRTQTQTQRWWLAARWACGEDDRSGGRSVGGCGGRRKRRPVLLLRASVVWGRSGSAAQAAGGEGEGWGGTQALPDVLDHGERPTGTRGGRGDGRVRAEGRGGLFLVRGQEEYAHTAIRPPAHTPHARPGWGARHFQPNG